MFIVPASAVSLPPTVVHLTVVSVPLNALDPHETAAAAADVYPVFAEYIQVFVLASTNVNVKKQLTVLAAAVDAM